MEAYLVLSSLHHPLNRSSAQKGSSPISRLGIDLCGSVGFACCSWEGRPPCRPVPMRGSLTGLSALGDFWMFMWFQKCPWSTRRSTQLTKFNRLSYKYFVPSCLRENQFSDSSKRLILSQSPPRHKAITPAHTTLTKKLFALSPLNIIG